MTREWFGDGGTRHRRAIRRMEQYAERHHLHDGLRYRNVRDELDAWFTEADLIRSVARLLQLIATVNNSPAVQEMSAALYVAETGDWEDRAEWFDAWQDGGEDEFLRLVTNVHAGLGWIARQMLLGGRVARASRSLRATRDASVRGLDFARQRARRQKSQCATLPSPDVLTARRNTILTAAPPAVSRTGLVDSAAA